MDMKTSVVVLVAGLMVMFVTCEAAPVSSDLLAEFLQKANVVLDNMIAKEKDAEAISRKEDQQAHLEVDQRNEDGSRPEVTSQLRSMTDVDTAVKRTTHWSDDFLKLICEELQKHGLDDPMCHGIGGEAVEPERRAYESSVTQEEQSLERTSKTYVNVIAEICAVFAKYNIVADVCQTTAQDRPATREISGQINDDEAEERALKEISQPEPVPNRNGVESDGDIDLKRVLKYLQYLRAENHKDGQ